MKIQGNKIIPPKTITVLENGLPLELLVSSILCCNSFVDHTCIWMKNNERHKVSGRLKKIEAMIDSVDFYRIDRYCLINLDKIIEIIYNDVDGVIRFNEIAKIKVSVAKIWSLLKLINDQNMGRVFRGFDSTNLSAKDNGNWMIIYHHEHGFCKMFQPCIAV